ncbi:hypothetical protein D7V97_34625 [Corallococcus sp. CA053C]|nr:hypothetical protein D7V97_34625 [Corallococcus sp. CA053C]
MPALTLTLCGLLFGCGGQPEDGESTEVLDAPDTQVMPAEGAEGTVTASAISTMSVFGASVSFNSNGDNFTVRDTAADGHSAVAHIYNSNTGSYSFCWNSSGSGTSVTCNRNFAEGILIRFRACTGEAGTGRLVNCSDWKTVSTAN